MIRPWLSPLVAIVIIGVLFPGAAVAQVGDPSGLPEVAAPPAEPEPKTFGLDASVSHTLQAFAFGGFRAVDYTHFGANGHASRYCVTTSCTYDAPLFLPAGVLVTSIELEACDTDAADSVNASLFRTGKLESLVQILATAATSGTPGCTTVTGNLASPATIDNVNNTYLVQVFTGTSSATRFQAVRVFYKLQVSSAPGPATFGDVSPTHPFFQFIEALVKSGITVGCGGGNYCPDNPLTRGEMAVFLSKGLGLHFAP